MTAFILLVGEVLGEVSEGIARLPVGEVTRQIGTGSLGEFDYVASAAAQD